MLLGFGAVTAIRVEAQTFTNLYNFTPLRSSTNSDGANSTAGLVLADNTLYGTTQNGGSTGRGTVFAVNINGTGFTNLHNFINSGDGANPAANLILSGGTLYGTTQSGGSSSRGTVFKVNTNGTGFSILHSFSSGFTNIGGTAPYASLIILSDTLYGTAFGGGKFGYGTVFSVNTNGIGFTELHSFDGTNGANPSAGLVLSGNTLYGTAYQGGFTNAGTVFAVTTNGTSFTNLHDFAKTDGANPYAGLIISGNTLYGTTRYGGSANCGTLFSLQTTGESFTNLHVFDGIDGNNPNGSLSLLNNTLFGSAYRGGVSGKGTVFGFNIDGNGFTNYYNFTATSEAPPFSNNDGANPACTLVISENFLYGTSSGGGTSGNGAIFSLPLPPAPPPPPQLTINLAGSDVVLTWPTNAPGFLLQSTTNLSSPAIWNTVHSEPVVVGGQNTVTNLISGAQQFYRLRQ